MLDLKRPALLKDSAFEESEIAYSRLPYLSTVICKNGNDRESKLLKVIFQILM